MDRAYTNALKRKKKLLAEIEALDVFLSMYRHFDTPSEEDDLPNSEHPATNVVIRDGYGREVRPLRPVEIADLAETVIRDAGEPLTRAEIVDRIENAGHVLNSDDKPRYVGTILWRQKDRFINIAGQGYILADMATPDLIDGPLPKDKENDDEETAKGIFD